MGEKLTNLRYIDFVRISLERTLSALIEHGISRPSSRNEVSIRADLLPQHWRPFLQRKSWYDYSSPRMLSQYGDI